MPALIRQQYIDPQDGMLKTKEMHVDVEMVRPDNNNSMNAVIQLKVEAVVERINNQFLPPAFAPVTVCPAESLALLLDGKRTSNPQGCWRTRLVNQCDDLKFIVHNIKDLNLTIGDPIVVLSNLDEPDNIMFGIVASFDKNTMTLYDTGQRHRFLKGSFIQNLANRYHPNDSIDGAKTQLKRPSSPTFRAKKAQDDIEVIFSVPLNPGVGKFYDVYIRDQPFDKIAPHWIADASDIPYDAERITIETFNGGKDAGGDNLSAVKPSKLYCAVIAKDRFGDIDVNESNCVLQMVGN